MHFLQGFFLLAFLLAFVKATERPDIFDHFKERANNVILSKEKSMTHDSVIYDSDQLTEELNKIIIKEREGKKMVIKHYLFVLFLKLFIYRLYECH